MPNGDVIRLKIYPQYFDAINAGTKTYEVRKRCRAQAGDTLELLNTETGKFLYVRVLDRLDFPNWYIKHSEPFCVFAIEKINS